MATKKLTYDDARRIVAARAGRLGFLVKRGKRVTIGHPDPSRRDQHDRAHRRLSIRRTVHVQTHSSGEYARGWSGHSTHVDVRDLAMATDRAFAGYLCKRIGPPKGIRTLWDALARLGG